ncbi:MAG: hypothetical protein LBC74_13535 [Planctomycetaceae bacterium]|nr:hypothetical protein [Planctomycetaceae bacterium]
MIVEKENGKKGTIEIAEIADDNKNYFYRRLAIRNIEIEEFKKFIEVTELQKYNKKQGFLLFYVQILITVFQIAH